MHDNRLQNAQEAANELHEDTTFSLEETRDRLLELRDHIDALIDCVESEIE